MVALRQLVGVALARDWALSLVGILLVGGSAAAYSIFVGRFMGATSLGHAGLSLAIALGTAQIVTAGIGPATTRFAALRLARGDGHGARRTLHSGIVASAVAGSVCAAAAALLLPRLAPALGLPSDLIVPTALLILLQSLYIALKASMYGIGRLNYYVLSELAAAVAFFAALAGHSIWSAASLVAPFLVANAVFVALVAAELVRRQGKAPSSGAAGESEGPEPAADSQSMPKYAAVATVGSVAALVRLQLPVLVLGLAWGAAEVGLLQATLIFLPLVLLLPRALELALFPAVSGSFSRDEAGLFRKQVAVSQNVVTAALALVAGALLVSGPYLMDLLYGNEFSGAGRVLDGIVIAAWALGLSVPTISALSGADRVAIPNLAGVLGLIVSLFAWWLLVPTEGAEGAAVGLALGSLVILLVPLAAAWRRYDLTLRSSGLVFVRTTVLVAVALYLSRVVGVHSLATAVGYSALVAVVELPRLARVVPRPARGAV